MEFVIIASDQIYPFAEKVVGSIRNRGGTVDFQRCEFTEFADQSFDVFIPSNVRKSNVYLLHSFVNPNDGYMQLFLMNDALKRASANEVVNVLPYIPYTRKDRKDRPRVPISAKLFASLTEMSGANRIITNDLHAGQIQGFYDIPVDNLEAVPHIARYINEQMPHIVKDLIVVAPDTGATKIVESLARRLRTQIAIINKRRKRVNQATAGRVIGDVAGRICLMFDDMIDTGGTICEGARALKKHGATAVYAACTHAVLSVKDGERAEGKLLGEIEEMIVTDSIPREYSSDRIHVLSLADLYGEAIWRTQRGESLSELFS
jgi:ribose-phosphate pyrophosphokinase